MEVDVCPIVIPAKAGIQDLASVSESGVTVLSGVGAGSAGLRAGHWFLAGRDAGPTQPMRAGRSIRRSIQGSGHKVADRSEESK